jgi:hypothetical protein
MNQVASLPRKIDLIDTVLLTDLLAIALLWCVSIIIVNPIGNFPIIDDELYAPAVRTLLETGHYRPPEATMTFITNELWGALFSLPVGASFTTLRFSTLCASLLGLFGLYTLVRDLGQPRWICWVVTLTLAFNPAYYAMSHSFMTDVLFAVICIWAATFFARSLKSGSDLELILGTLLALAATLSRQIGLAVPLAFAVAVILRRGITWKTMLRAAIPVAICSIALFWFYHFLAASGRLPVTYNLFTNQAISTFTHSQTLFTTPVSNVYCTVVYLGLYLLPVLLCTTGGLPRSGEKGTFAVAAVGAAVVVLGAVVRSHIGSSDFMPLPEGHILRPTGIGLPWLRGAKLLPSLPEPFWICVTALAFVGAALLIFHVSVWVSAVARSLSHRSRMSEAQTVTLFLLLCGFLLAVPYIGIRTTDRYMISCLPFLAAGMVSLSTISSGTAISGLGKPLRYGLRYGPFGLLAACCIFSVTGTRDYLAWHRVSAEASRDLMETSHIPPENIDGGIEFDFLYPAPASREDIHKKLDKVIHDRPQYFFTEPIRKQFEVLIADGWRPESPQYLVAFGSVPGYRSIREYTYDNWIPSQVRKIVVLQKE